MAVISRSRLQLLNHKGYMAMAMVVANLFLILIIKMTTTIIIFSIMSKISRLSTRIAV